MVTLLSHDPTTNSASFYADTIAELASLPNITGTAGNVNHVSQVIAGSTALVKEDDSVYILTGDNEWIKFGNSLPINECINFESDAEFTLSLSDGAHWNGEVDYSYDKVDWNYWDGTNGIASSLGSDGNHHVYLRGIGNTHISSGNSAGNLTTFSITSESTVKCIGSLATLLDWKSVVLGKSINVDPCCFACLFDSCEKLSQAPELGIDTAPIYGCYRMFYGCVGLTIPMDKLPAKNLDGMPGAYYEMFSGCTNLLYAPDICAQSAKNAPSVCTGMFMNSGIVTGPNRIEIRDLEGSTNCFRNMFYGCANLSKCPDLYLADKLPNNACEYMFYGCTSMECEDIRLVSKTIGSNSYSHMFSACTGMTTGPAVMFADTFLATYCCDGMFEGCTNLVNIFGELPANNLTESCYNEMFKDCENLTHTPNLPAKNLAKRCYFKMFYNDHSLTTVSELPAEILPDGCYSQMFYKCSAIPVSEVPDLGHVTSGANGCCESMFLMTDIKCNDNIEQAFEDYAEWHCGNYGGLTSGSRMFDSYDSEDIVIPIEGETYYISRQS